MHEAAKACKDCRTCIHAWHLAVTVHCSAQGYMEGVED